MFLKRILLSLALAALFSVPSQTQQESGSNDAENTFLPQGRLDVDFLFNYYDQDGDHSPVTGGEGTEDLQVITPVILLRWRVSEKWEVQADLGVDGITSASTDNIDDNVSSASRMDTRGHGVFTVSRQLEGQSISFTAGFSGEYDYRSIIGGLSWSKSFRGDTSSLSASLRHYSDTVDLYDIDGVQRGEDDRTTTDLSLGWTQILSPRAIASVEVFSSSQSGFLSTPFHEVILAPSADHPAGQVVTERLPDSRRRSAIGLRLNYSLSKKVVQRAYFRYYDDDWGITAQSLELETHFRLPVKATAWVYPILRFHTQDGSDYFGLPRTFSGSEEFLTADRDLSEFDSDKYGLGFQFERRPGPGGKLVRFRGFDSRLTTYSRDDGLDAISASLALRWRF